MTQNVPTNALPPWRRVLRRAARKLLPTGGLTAPGVRQVLGVESEDGRMVDRVDQLRVEFALSSIIGQQLFIAGGFEDGEAEFLRERLAQWPSPVLLDVGANIGLHSLRVARTMPTVRIAAFEPGRETFAMLDRNVARNGLRDRIQTYPLAVAAEAGRARFHFCTDDAYSSLVPDGRRAVQQTYEVEVISLDEWVPKSGLERIHFIKLDVEGGEPEVIAGARRTLQQWKPELLVEIYQGDRRPGFATGLIEQISGLGYEPFVLQAGRPVPFVRHDDDHFNYFFRPRP
jgi:FkbM family methyltransferase